MDNLQVWVPIGILVIVVVGLLTYSFWPEKEKAKEPSTKQREIDELCARHTRDLAQIREQMDPDRQLQHLLRTSTPHPKKGQGKSGPRLVH